MEKILWLKILIKAKKGYLVKAISRKVSLVILIILFWELRSFRRLLNLFKSSGYE